MNKKAQYVITICVDMIMLAIVAIASYFLLTHGFTGWKQYVLQGVIIAAIPTIFFLTYMTFAGHKYDSLPDDEEDEDREEDEDHEDSDGH